MTKRKPEGQLDLFASPSESPAPRPKPAPGPWTDALRDQILRDLATLRDEPPQWNPAFFEERVVAYRAELERLTHESVSVPVQE